MNGTACFLVHAGVFSSCVLPFRRHVSSCPSVPLSGGEIQNVLILVTCCKFICSPAFTPVCSPLVLFSKGNIWLGKLPASVRTAWVFRLVTHALDTRHTVKNRPECISVNLVCRGHSSHSLSPLQRSSYCVAACQVHSNPCRIAFASVMFCPSFHTSCPTRHTWPSY